MSNDDAQQPTPVQQEVENYAKDAPDRSDRLVFSISESEGRPTCEISVRGTVLGWSFPSREHSIADSLRELADFYERGLKRRTSGDGE